MKRLLCLLPALLLVACQPEPAKPLPGPDPETVTVTLLPTNSGLVNDDSTSVISVSLDIKEHEEKYQLDFSSGCYLHSSHPEFVIKSGSYFKSVSNYHVDRLIVDFFGGKGTFFDVYASNDGSGEKVMYHSSEITPIDKDGGGVVYEYPIDSSGWMIKNNTTDNKAAFYSVTIVFSL